MFRPPKMNTLINILGVPTYLAGVLLNIGDWKGNLLIFFGVVFSFFKIIRLLVNLWQDYREREIEIRAKKKRYGEDEQLLK